MQITAALYDCKNHPVAQWGGRAGHNDRVSNLRLFWETGSRGAVIRQTTDYFCHIHLDCTVQKGLTRVLGIANIYQLISDIHLVARKKSLSPGGERRWNKRTEIDWDAVATNSGFRYFTTTISPTPSICCVTCCLKINYFAKRIWYLGQQQHYQCCCPVDVCNGGSLFWRAVQSPPNIASR